MFRRILIANRAEIALRIIRACHELDIEAVCVFSEEDRGAEWLRLADRAICVGGAAPRAGELALAQLRNTTALVEVLPESRVWRVDDDVELHGSFEFLGKVVAVMRSLGEATRMT